MATMDWESIRQTFFTESGENLSNMENSILALESGDDDPETVNILFRAVHTIKGSSGMFGCPELERFAHAVENTLQKLRSGAIAVDSRLLEILMACHDHMKELLTTCEGENPAAGTGIEERGNALLEKLESAPAGKAAEAGTTTAPARDSENKLWKITIAPGADLFRRGLDPRNFIAYMAEIGEIVSLETILHSPSGDMDPESCYLGFDIVYRGTASPAELKDVFQFLEQDCAISIEPAEGTRPAPVATVGSAAATAAGTAVRKTEGHPGNAIRIDTGKIDQLINNVGELVISNAAVMQLSKERDGAGLADSIDTMSRLIESVRESAMNIRMVPIAEAFARFNRAVRDLSRELGKEVEFTVEGGDTEIDKSMMEAIIDPLMHIIRNSMDHGIEEPAERAAHGKQARGRITLKAFQESGSMVIECADDGRGLDLEKIAAKAKSLGLLPADRATSDEEIRNMIFAPGFSTSDKVSSVSGRGVGMDVVRKNVEALRGSVSLRSERNEGTAIVIRLPLTLAIIDGFIVIVGETRFVIPLYSVTECIDVPHSDVHEDEGCAYIDLRGEALPFIRLDEVFGHAPDRTAKLRVVVVEHGRGRTGLGVGSFIGENQIVVKPLGRIFSRHPWISGFTILGSGGIAPILDVMKLVPGSGTCHWTAMPEAPHLHREAGASSLHAKHN